MCFLPFLHNEGAVFPVPFFHTPVSGRYWNSTDFRPVQGFLKYWKLSYAREAIRVIHK